MGARARLLATAVVAALLLLLAGCGAAGDDGGTTASPGPRPAAPPSAAPPPSAGSEDGSGGGSEDGSGDSSGDHVVDGRPFELVVPPAYDDATPAPVIMVLHGFGSSGVEVDALLGLRQAAAARGAIYVVPEGTPDSGDRRFWNATRACCDFGRSEVDDSGYLADVLRDVAATYSVDPSRVVVAGHSNGGFMAYRLACEHADLVSYAVSVAGAMTSDDAACAPSQPVSVLQVHGTADRTIRYEGGSNGPFPYPSAPASVEAWARLDGCSATAERSGALDLDGMPDAETSVTAFPGCDDGARVELWTMEGTGHAPAFGDAFPDTVLDRVLG